MADRNHSLRYRPLLGGISIFNPLVGKSGTIGLIVFDSNEAPWILTNYHVLAGERALPLAAPEPIYQPSEDCMPPVAIFDGSRADMVLDCAAAKVESGVPVSREILCLPPIASLPAAPDVGMRVLKSGSSTGITEGVVTGVNGFEVEISVPHQFPPVFDVSGGGDSGSVWVERSSLAPVALHYRGNLTGREMAFAMDIAEVLRVLRLGIA